MSGHIEQLREKYPTVSPGFFDLLEEQRETRKTLSDLRGQLAYLIGYHSERGAVPVGELRKVLDGERVVEL